MLQLSVVVPVYAGAEYLDDLCDELAALANDLQTNDVPIRLSEAVFVDDASRDNSSEVLEALQEKHDFVQVVTMSRNFGQHPATIAGIVHTTGDWVVSLDEDLQHPPAYIPGLLAEAVVDGSDVVYGRSADRERRPS